MTKAKGGLMSRLVREFGKVGVAKRHINKSGGMIVVTCRSDNFARAQQTLTRFRPNGVSIELRIAA